MATTKRYGKNADGSYSECRAKPGNEGRYGCFHKEHTDMTADEAQAANEKAAARNATSATALSKHALTKEPASSRFDFLEDPDFEDTVKDIASKDDDDSRCFAYTYSTSKDALASLIKADSNPNSTYDDDTVNTLKDIATADGEYSYSIGYKRDYWNVFKQYGKRKYKAPEFPWPKGVDLKIDDYGRPVLMVGLRQDETPLKLSDKGRGSFFSMTKRAVKRDGFKGNDAILVVYNYDNPAQYNYTSMGKGSSLPLDDAMVKYEYLGLR